MTRKCHNHRPYTNERYHEEEAQNTLGLGCMLLKSKIPISLFLKIANIISTKVLIRTEVTWFIPKCT